MAKARPPRSVRARVRAPRPPETSPERFAAFLEHFTWKPAPSIAPLTQVAFFLGAGFSKSWDPRCPTGAELFTWPADLGKDAPKHFKTWLQWRSRIAECMTYFGSPGFAEITAGQLRDVVYHLQMGIKYPHLLPRYFDVQSSQMLLDELAAITCLRYKFIAPIYPWDPQGQKFRVGDLTPEQESIVRFFYLLQGQEHGSMGVTEGLRFNFVTTNYDALVETIMDLNLGDDDSPFIYMYRGVSPRRVCDAPPLTLVPDHHLAFQLLKLNGGFEILRSGSDYLLEYRDRSPEEILSSPPVLILPSREQEYLDPYFRSVIPKAMRLMSEARVLVIVGYSIPADDALFRLVLRRFAETAEDGLPKEVFYVDRCSEDEQLSRLRQIFPHSLNDHPIPRCTPYCGDFATWTRDVLKASVALGVSR
jgi:hypothetical protein